MGTRDFGGTIGTTVRESTPFWPAPDRPPAGAPNVLLVLLDDVGFADFGCYGSEIATPTIDRLAARRAALHRLPHDRDVLDDARRAAHRPQPPLRSGWAASPTSTAGSRATAARSTPTPDDRRTAPAPRVPQLPGRQVARHPLTETGPTGPFDGWPLGRGFDRFYGFLDAETDQYSPELVRDNTHVAAPGTTRPAITSPRTSSTRRSRTSPGTTPRPRTRRGS